MKQEIHVFLGCIIMAFMVANCLAGDDMAERAFRLMTALNIQTNTESKVASRHVFSGTTTVTAGDFLVKQKKTTVDESGSVVDVDVFDKEGQVIATGRIIECESSSAAQKALVAQLVQNSMPLDMLIRTYELRRDEVGEFCVLNRVVNRSTGETSVSPAVIHFVRGGKAISLYALGKKKDVWAAAKAIDAVLSEVSATQGQTEKIENNHSPDAKELARQMDELLAAP